MATLSELERGQPHAVEILAAAIRGGRLHHAYLFIGSEPSRTQMLARAIAASLVCAARRDVDACGECAPCRKLAGDNHPDVFALTPNEKDVIPIDKVREATGRLGLRASEAPVKVVLLLRAEQMNAQAQNALLKTLEEPPGATCFLLGTNRPRALLPTIRSRCQKVHVSPGPRADAWRALAQAGASEELARLLAALVGSDTARAQALLELGAAEVLAELQEARRGRDLGRLLRAAATLGAERGKADLAFALLEVMLRDELARARGASPERLYDPSAPTSDAELARLARTADRLRQLRAQAAFNVNRVLALESVLFELMGVDGAGPREAETVR